MCAGGDHWIGERRQANTALFALAAMQEFQKLLCLGLNSQTNQHKRSLLCPDRTIDGRKRHRDRHVIRGVCFGVKQRLALGESDVTAHLS